MNLTEEFLKNVSGLFPANRDFDIVQTWEVPFQTVAQCAAEGLPTAHVPLPLGMQGPVELNFWQSFYLTAIREAHRGCSLMVQHHPNRAALTLLLVRRRAQA